MKLVLYTTCVCGIAQGLSMFVYSIVMHDSKTDRYIQTYSRLFLAATNPYANLPYIPTPSSYNIATSEKTKILLTYSQ